MSLGAFNSHSFLAVALSCWWWLCNASTHFFGTAAQATKCPSSCVVLSQPGTRCCSFCKKHWLKVKGLAGLSKAEAWTWNCAVGTVCASTLWWFYFSLDGEQQHTRTKGKLGRELPSEWPFSPFAGGGGKPLPFIGSRTQVSKWQNKVNEVKEGESLGCVRRRKQFQRKLYFWEAAVAVCVWRRKCVGFVTSAGLGGVLLKVKQDMNDRWAKTLPRSVIKFQCFFSATSPCVNAA